MAIDVHPVTAAHAGGSGGAKSTFQFAVQLDDTDGRWLAALAALTDSSTGDVYIELRISERVPAADEDVFDALALDPRVKIVGDHPAHRSVNGMVLLVVVVKHP